MNKGNKEMHIEEKKSVDIVVCVVGSSNPNNPALYIYVTRSIKAMRPSLPLLYKRAGVGA